MAVTVTVVLLPAVMVEGEAVSTKMLAAAGLTVTVALPVTELVAVSYTHLTLPTTERV